MSQPPKSLSEYVPWMRLASTLDIQPRDYALPTQVLCPICQTGVMRVFADPLDGGQWFSCDDCSARGDMIELAAKIWKTDSQFTVEKLSRLGYHVPTDEAAIRKYERRYPERRQRIDQFWEEAKQGAHDEHRRKPWRLTGRLRMDCEIPAERFNTGLGQLFGVSDAVRVETCFSPKSMRHAENHRRRNNPSQHATFRGGGWGDVAVIPFYDLPGRISAFALIGRGEDPKKDFVFKRVSRGGFRGNKFTKPHFEAGLALTPEILDAAGRWERTVVAVPDPVLYLRLQSRHFLQAFSPLPLISWYDSILREGALTRNRCRTLNWDLVGNRRVVLWMPTFQEATMQQAIGIDALISTAGPRNYSEENLKQFMWRFLPRDLLRRIVESARPWPRVLAKHLATEPDSALEKMLLHLENDGHDVTQILRRCKWKLETRAGKILATAGRRTTTANGHVVVEQNGTWSTQGTYSRKAVTISEAIIRIDKVIFHRAQDRAYLEGRVLFQGREIPFFELEEPMRVNPAKWLKNLVATNCRAVLGVSHRWSKDLLDLAKSLHKPQFEMAAERVGWDLKRVAFVFPQFRIHFRGRVEAKDEPVLIQQGPARQLVPPSGISPLQLHCPATEDAYTGALFWATIACFLANVVGPARFVCPVGVGLAGEGATAMGRVIAAAAGCAIHECKAAADVRNVLQAETLHDWPILAIPGPSLRQRHRGMLVDRSWHEPCNRFVSIDFATSRAMALRGDWRIVTGLKPLASTLDLPDVVDSLIPDYLEDLCQRRMRVAEDQRRPGDTFLDLLLKDLARYVGKWNGDVEAVWSAQTVLQDERKDGHQDAVLELLAWLIESKHLAWIATGAKAGLVPLGDGSRLLLTRQAWDLTTRRCCAVEVPLDRVSEALGQCGGSVEEAGDSWVFPARWLRRQVREFRARQIGFGVVDSPVAKKSEAEMPISFVQG